MKGNQTRLFQIDQLFGRPTTNKEEEEKVRTKRTYQKETVSRYDCNENHLNNNNKLAVKWPNQVRKWERNGYSKRKMATN